MHKIIWQTYLFWIYSIFIAWLVGGLLMEVITNVGRCCATYYIHRWVTQGKSIKYVSDSWQLIMPLLVFYEPSLDLQRNCFQISTKNITFNFNDTYYVLLPHQWLMGVRFRLINISQSKLWTFPMTSIYSIGPHTLDGFVVMERDRA